MTSFGAAAESRDNNLDFLRFALAATVVISHSFPLTTGTENRDLLFILSGGVLTFSRTALAGFFILSGFLVSKSWDRSPRLGDFTRRRALRIFPGYVAAAVFCLLVAVPLSAGHFKFEGRLARDLLLMNPPKSPAAFVNNAYPGHVNGSLWTVRYELWCYAIIAALGMLRLLSSAKAALTLMTLSILADAVNTRWRLVGDWDSVPLVGVLAVWPKFLGYFFSGAVFYLFRRSIPRSGTALAASALLMLATIASGEPPVVQLGICLFAPYVLFSLAFSDRLRLHGFGRQGDLSYGVYLYAWPIQQLFVQFVPALRRPWPLAAASLSAVIACGFLSWHLIEKPFLRAKQSPTALPPESISHRT